MKPDSCKYLHQVSASTPLHVSWLLIAYERLFHHPSVSLVRWGLESFLRLPWNQPSLGSIHFQNFLTSSLLEVLNQNKIYCGGEGDEDADATFTASDYFPDQNDLKLTGQVVAKALSNFLNRCFTLLEGKSGELVRRLVSGVVLQPWAPLPLLWVSIALKNLSVPRCLGDCGVKCLRSLVDGQMASMEPLIRGAAQTNILLAMTQLVDPKICKYQPLANLIYCLWTKGVFIAGTPLWTTTANFLR